MSTPESSIEGMLSDGFVIVRGLQESDAPDMAAAVAPGEYAVWESEPGPYSLERAVRVVRTYERGLRQLQKAAFAVLDAFTGEFVGSVVFTSGGPQAAHDDDELPVWLTVPDAVELACWTRMEARGRGYATRAVGLLSKWALDELGLSCVWIEIPPGNMAAERVAEKAGFVLEVLANDHCLDPESGEPHDCLIYARLLGEEPPELAAFHIEEDNESEEDDGGGI